MSARIGKALPILVAGYLLFALGRRLAPPLPSFAFAAINVAFLVSIAYVHALRRYALWEFAAFVVVAFVVGNAYENLSIVTGFPFGHYHYSDSLGPKLFNVPLLIAPAYLGGGYLAWTLAHMILGLHGARPRGLDRLFTPLIAAFAMTAWDMTMDPIASTVRQSWVWHDGGPYFGVPISNFLGWLLCVYTMYQVLALLPAAKTAPPAPTRRFYWLLACLAYLTMGLDLALDAWTEPSALLKDAAGAVWRSGDLFGSVALVALFTMGFAALLAAIQTLRMKPAS